MKMQSLINRSALASITGLAILLTSSLRAQEQGSFEWTDTEFPNYVTKVTDFGERADWSHDGKRFLFVERSFGDVYEYNVETKRYRPLTHHYYHAGYVRALYLSNGDILLSGPTNVLDGNWREARFRKSELWILDKNLSKPPVRLGEYCWEGPAASRTQLRIAWANHHGLYPQQKRYYQLFVADIDYSSGEPRIANQRVVLDNTEGLAEGQVLEPQNFRPGNENELIVQAYGRTTCMVTGLNLETGEMVDYSQNPEAYNEPEGIFPDGQYTLVESSRHAPQVRGMNIDLWKLKLDADAPTWERLTYFSEARKFKASNPVVSDDGTRIAFQVPKLGDVAGIGYGIYILDLTQRPK